MDYEEKKVRGLDGFYRRVKRGDKFVNRCFTDLTDEEQREWLDKLFKLGLCRMIQSFGEYIANIAEMPDITDEERREMVLMMAGVLRFFGNRYGIVNGHDEDEE